MSSEASGTVFGIPYNFERPTLKRLISAYWRPGEGMITETPFGVGYTLNLANWRSWVVLAVALVLFLREGREGETEEPVDVVVED
ncbi:MAG: DUF5808 domain-containing protein [Halodesulfurarchaeum sp.]